MSQTNGGGLSLGGTAARGGAILGAATTLESAFQFLRALILARILGPQQFGLMAMAIIAVQASEALSQTGFFRAIVQKQGEVDSYLDTVWVICLIRGVFLTTVVCLVAPVVGLFFSNAAVVPILRVISSVFLIQAFLNPALFLLEKEFSFLRLATPRTVGSVVDFAISTVLAFEMRNVWSMVWGFLAGKLTYVVISHLVRRYRPRLRLRWDQAKELYDFGKHIFQGSVVDYIVSQLDRLVIGRVMGPLSLGLYSVAGRIARLPATAIFNVVLRVVFPVFSRIQGEAQRLRTGFLRGFGMMAALTAPVAAGVFAIAPDFVAVVLRDRWSGMVDPLRLLSLVGVTLALNNLMGAVLSAVGSPNITARGSYVFLASMVVPIYPSTVEWGLIGAAGCLGVASLCAFVYLLSAILRKIDCPARRALKELVPPLLGAAGMGLLVVGLRAWIGGPPGWTLLVLEIALGALSFPVLTILLDKALHGGLLVSVQSALRST